MRGGIIGGEGNETPFVGMQSSMGGLTCCWRMNGFCFLGGRTGGPVSCSEGCLGFEFDLVELDLTGSSPSV